MKLKQLFCRHKKLSAVGIYEKPLTYSIIDVRIVCKCDKCDKELEYSGAWVQYLSKHYKKQINIDKVFNHELWGRWW